jgi:hypothetical protein
MMRRSEVDRHARIIEGRTAALKWLTEHATKFTGKKEDAEGQFQFEPWEAASVDGADEATKVIEAYARCHLPEIVKSAITCCRNDIMSREAIERELATLDATPD